jgi:hypothetical protein
MKLKMLLGTCYVYVIVTVKLYFFWYNILCTLFYLIISDVIFIYIYLFTCQLDV